MSFGLEDLHTPKNVQELERVEILPYDSSRTANSGTFTLPNGLTWADFGGGVTAVLSIGGAWHNEQTVSAEQISKVVDGYLFRVSYSTTSVDYIVRIYKDSDTTGSWSIPASSSTNASLLHIYGTKRKFSTTPISRTIELGTIGINENITLYEVDIGSEFFNSDGTIKESVKTEVWLHDGSMWFHADSVIYNYSVAGRYGARASKFINDTGASGIVVRTGNQTTNGLNAAGCLTASAVNLDSAPARLVVSMGERYAPVIA